MDTPKSILDGVDGLIDSWCGLTDPSRFGTTTGPRYASKQAAIDLSKNGGPLGASASQADASALFRQILDQLEANQLAAGGGQASPVVWELRRETALSAENDSPEKVLEKLVAMLLGPEWSNQVAVASGLIPGADADKKRAIDLVHDCGDGEYEFIELKYGDAKQGYGSNNPLYAAWEIVLYGLLYAHYRVCCSPETAYPLLAAKRIHLVVLALEGYYTLRQRGGSEVALNLAWLERALNKALASLSLPGVSIDFAFQKFAKDFEALYTDPKPLSVGAQAFRKANLSGRKPMH